MRLDKVLYSPKTNIFHKYTGISIFYRFPCIEGLPTPLKKHVYANPLGFAALILSAFILAASIFFARQSMSSQNIAKMLDSRAFEMFAAFPSIQATLVLFIIGYAVRWYFSSLPSRLKFPKADLDGNDWYGSLVRATAKVGCHRTMPNYLVVHKPTRILVR